RLPFPHPLPARAAAVHARDSAAGSHGGRPCRGLPFLARVGGASTCGAADRLRAGTPAPGAPAGGLSRQRFPDHLVTGEPTMNRMSRRFLLALAFAAGAAAAQAQTLRIGLAEDPDALDPSLARTFVGRLVFAGLCDKLF